MSDVIQNWAKEINWKKRVQSLCKPCWELKYCPYGPLVEYFPISEESNSKSCRIFGHQCPVFFTSEPFTETKELRRVSRHIPRDIQFKVLKRDNQICRICGKNVFENNIEFDHFIPYSKGGPTEEHNIRLVCSECNKKKSDNFEEEYLVNNFVELVSKPMPITFVRALLDSCRFYHDYKSCNEKEPELEEYNKIFNDADGNKIGDVVYTTVQKIVSLISFQNTDSYDDLYEPMKYRWGFCDGKIHSVKSVMKKYDISKEKFFEMEIKFVNHIGWVCREGRKEF